MKNSNLPDSLHTELEKIYCTITGKNAKKNFDQLISDFRTLVTYWENDISQYGRSIFTHEIDAWYPLIELSVKINKLLSIRDNNTFILELYKSNILFMHESVLKFREQFYDRSIIYNNLGSSLEKFNKNTLLNTDKRAHELLSKLKDIYSLKNKNFSKNEVSIILEELNSINSNQYNEQLELINYILKRLTEDLHNVIKRKHYNADLSNKLLHPVHIIKSKVPLAKTASELKQLYENELMELMVYLEDNMP